ncbi:pentapeptide repeat-containing protein [Calothrix sp. 336/3]|uniref:pentapeptide repeat-containing protein n=1 Tax=Calothrix sp. 336/3 TaxID=1337936 RepID=UPI0004E2C5C8|nr:pentapeptide repeat-containing protein [Calothrix sp. 336/3]AKG22511.1 low-complexity protein [Calothrix sp. 336/3]
MATPTVRRSKQQSSNEFPQSGKSPSLSLNMRRFAAWTTEMTLVVASGLIPFSMGAYANSFRDLNRVPLNPLLVATEREVARPLALPVSYGTRNVAFPTNFLWTVAILAPITVSFCQLYLLATRGSSLPKRWFGVKVVNSQGNAPGFGAIAVREGVGRWTVPVAVAYYLWRYSPVFPNILILTGLAGLIMLSESMGFPWQKKRRALHDQLAATYTIDANQPFNPSELIEETIPWTENTDEEAAIASVVMTPEPAPKVSLRDKLRQNPSTTLLGVALFSMAGVLTALIGTQIYIQTQQSRLAEEQKYSQQFLTFAQRLSPNSKASIEERRTAILALGTLKYPQGTKYLVNLLTRETNPILIDAIQQALANIGTSAIPELKRTNHSLVGDLDNTNSTSPGRELRQSRLSANQRAISKILTVYSGQTLGIDLSRINLAQSGLILDKIDLWGVKFRGANLSQGSLKGASFRGIGEDGRWDTYDDWISDLSNAQFQESNLTEANLSRVLMSRANFSRAILNKANLSSARLTGVNLSSAQLIRADLRNAILENASLTGADLSEAKLQDADLYAARLGRVIASSTRLSFANLSHTDWQGSDLSGAYLDRTDLRNANLSAARLSNANLQNANLQNANFRNADLSHADLQGANLAGADFQGATLFSGKADPTDQFVQTPTTGSQSAIIKGVDFSQVKNLDTKQLAYICTQGGIHPRCP